MPKNPDNTKKKVEDFDAREKAMIIERNKVVGSRKTAEEFGTTWQAVLAIKKANILELSQRYKSEKSETSTHAAEETPKTYIALEKMSMFSEKTTLPKIPEDNEQMKKRASLEMENALLREKISRLTEHVEKLRSAVSYLA